MIHPNMCTMLGYVATDAVIEKEVLQKLLREDVVDTYNMISVDGDTSTNDMLLVLANGMAGNPTIQEGTADYEAFRAALHYVNETQAKRLAGDGEGATALVECHVYHADTKENARILAKKCHLFQPDQGCCLRTRCQLGKNPVCTWLFRSAV